MNTNCYNCGAIVDSKQHQCHVCGAELQPEED